MIVSTLPPLAPSLRLAHVARDRDALLDRPREGRRLPGGVPHLRAEREVGVVAGAQGVAVHEERALAVEVDHRRIGNQAQPGLRAEPRRHHEVAVAVHEVRRDGAGRRAQQARDPRGKVERQPVVADPVLEEVAQDVEGVGARHGLGEEAREALGGRRAILREVQVGDEEGARHAGKRRATRGPPSRRSAGPGPQRHSAFSMTTGSSGTFWCMPALPVATLRILSTTSWPSTTLPNTA